MKWWVYEDGEPSPRPYTKRELRESVDIGPDTRVRARDGTFRRPARQVPELQDLFPEPDTESPQTVSRDSFGDILQQAEPPTPDKHESTRESPNALDRFLREQNRFQFEHLLTNPFLFFRRLDTGGSNLFALGFALAMLLVGRFFVLTYASLIPGYKLPIQLALQPFNVGGGSLTLILIFYFLFLLPLFMSFMLLLGSAISHVILALFGWKRAGFSATFKVCCYSSVSGLAQTIPLMGGGLAALWGLVLFVIGMMEVQDLSATKAIFMSLLPLGLTAGLISLGITL